MQSTEVVNGLECLIDWVGITFFDFSSPIDVLSYLGFSDSDFTVSRGRNGYKSSLSHNQYNISLLYDGTDDMGFHLDISGSALSGALDAYKSTRTVETPWGTYAAEILDDGIMLEFLRHINECGKFTRIDLAVDDKGCNYFSVDDVKKLYKDGACVSRFRKFKHEEEMDSPEHQSGNTVYFGKRVSSAMLRVYDKKLERISKGEVIDFDWVRWELELKKERAQMAVDFILSGKNLGAVIMGLLYNYLRFVIRDDENVTRCSELPLWGKFMENISRLKMSVARVEKDIEKVKDWIKRQVMPSMAWIVACDGGDLGFFTHNLKDALFRNSKTKLDALFKANPALKEEFAL